MMLKLIFLLAIWIQSALSQFMITSKTLFRSDGVNSGLVGWDSWGRNNIILFTRWNGVNYEMRSIKPDGSGEDCLSCSMTPLIGVSVGTGQFSPDGKWILFEAQDGTSPSVGTPPGNGSNYNVWFSDYPRVNGPWKLSPQTNSAALWPVWSTDGSRIAFAKMYAAADGTHTRGYWNISLWSFSAGVFTQANPSSCEPQPAAGIYETGNWSDATHVNYISQNGLTTPSQYNYTLYSLNVLDCSVTQLSSPAVNAWLEFPRTEAALGGSWLFWTASQNATPFCTGGQITPCTDEYYAAPAGYTDPTYSPVQITNCMSPSDPMYVGANTSAFCVSHGVSPDGSRMLIQRQTDTWRDLWMLTIDPSHLQRLGSRSGTIALSLGLSHLW